MTNKTDLGRHLKRLRDELWEQCRRLLQGTMPLDPYTPMENATRTLLWDRIQERTRSQFRDSLRMYLWSQFRTRSSGQPWVLRDLLTDQLEEDWSRNRQV